MEDVYCQKVAIFLDNSHSDPSQKSRQTLPLKRMLISQEKLTCPNALVQNLNNKLLAMP